jgi:hypothetical protein
LSQTTKPKRDLPVRLVIEEAAAVGFAVLERPALGVDHLAGDMVRRVDVPQFLDADAIDLRLGIPAQIELALELLGEMAADAFAEEGVFGVELEAGLVIGLVGAVARDAHVAGGDALHAAVVIVEDLGGREAREDLDAQLLGLAGQPAAEIAQRAGIGALVVEIGRRDELGEARLALFGQHPVMVLGDRGGGERAQSSRQSGSSSSSARGSTTAPDRICAPTSEPFSRMHTESSCPPPPPAA